MPTRKVTTIPATITRFTHAPLAAQKKRRTAGYARVSTDSDEQFTSYAAQVDYYTQYIKSREDWEFVAVYTDEGISGTSTARREGFRTMIADALEGKIDLIVTKSVSRFARNTVDSLTTVRQLKEKGIEIYFEKENIWTLDSKGELLISIMSSLAQEESRSISENVTWGKRKRFADGKVCVPFGQFLGYDRGEDGSLVLNKDEAAIVKRIFSMFLQGMTPYGIASKLTAEGIPSPGKKPKWNQGTVRSMLANEKYKGDALLQKTYTTDFLTKKKKINEGEVPQYYVTGSHEAIIEPEIFDMVQRELARRSKGKNRHSGVHAFSGKIKCGACGSWFGSKVWHSNDKYRRVIWRCNHKFDGEKCATPHVDDQTIEAAFIKAVNLLIEGRDTVLEDCAAIKELLFSTDVLEKERTELQQEIDVISKMIQDVIGENARIAIDQTDFQSRYESLVQRFDDAKEKYDAVCAEMDDKRGRRAIMEQFLEDLARRDTLLTEFEAEAWHALVDFVTIYAVDDIRVTFKNGKEIRA